jgi:hypothetical protein
MRKRVSVFVCMHLERHEVEKLSRLLQCRDAAVWVHIRVCNWQAVDVLSGGVRHSRRSRVRDCTERKHVTKVHIYPTTLLGSSPPRIGKRVHVHYVETAGGRNSA